MGKKLPTYSARIRMPLTGFGAGLIIVGALFGILYAWLIGMIVFIAGLVMIFMPYGAARDRDAVQVRPPVTGAWLAINSPADRVPSHGLHAYGQTYAIDLVYQPSWTSRPDYGWWPLAQRPQDFHGFGRPVHAPAEGVVVRVHDRQRDHWSRSSWPALMYMVAESMVREPFGPSRILGNHVVLDLGNGVYAALAHLRRGSVRVTKGQRVTAGEQIADCGNSGNSAEPHLHFQLMDHPNVMIAAGIPFSFDRFDADGQMADNGGVPRNGQTFAAA